MGTSTSFSRSRSTPRSERPSSRPMRWLCSLLVSVAATAGAAAAAAQSSPAQHLQFDVAAIPATRDSFVFLLRGEPRGFAVWQYEIRSAEMGQDVVFTARSEFRPAEEEIGRASCREGVEVARGAGAL